MPRNPGIPHYREIADRLLGKLIGGGPFRLPSENALARQFGVARMTARRALEELRAKGYVERVRGSGTFSTQASARVVYFIGYDLGAPYFRRFRSRLLQKLGAQGYRLVTIDAGLEGEGLRATAELVDAIRASEAVVWYAPSEAEGSSAAARLRRRLPLKLPMILLNDPLGLSLHSTHRFDLVHFDVAEAVRRLVDVLIKRGIRHPVLVHRKDVRLYSTEQLHRGFVASLDKWQVNEIPKHVVNWDPSERLSRVLEPLLSRRKIGWKPDAFILEFDYSQIFRKELPAPQRELPLFAFGRTESNLNLAGDTKVIADVCADLLLSRFKNPRRPNLHVQVCIPPRGEKAHSGK